MGLMGSKRSVKVDPEPDDLKDVEVRKTPFPKKRACTDVFCLLLLFIFMVVLSGLLVYCIKFGDIARITMGYDYCGNVCGKVTERVRVAPNDPKYTCFGADMRKNRFLLVTNAGLWETQKANVNRECVASCQYYPGFREFLNRCIPKKGMSSSNQRQLLNWNSGGSVGHFDGGGWEPSWQQLAEEQEQSNVSEQVVKQPPLVVSTKNKAFPDLLLPLNKGNRTRRHAAETVHGRRLLQYQQQGPVERIDEHFSKTGNHDFFQEVAEDLDLCWKDLLSLFFIALGFTMVIMLFLFLAVKLVVILSLVISITVSLFVTTILWVVWANKQGKLAEKLINTIQKRFIECYHSYAIAASVIIAIIFLALFVLRKRLCQVIRLFEESGRAISDMPELLVLPWVSFAIVGGLIAGWFYLALWIESSGTLVSEKNMILFYEKDGVAHVARWWNLVALFWLVQFVMACQHLVVAGAVGNWYFSRDKAALKHPVDRSIARTISYHLGTAVFGATLVAPLHFVRVLLQQLFRGQRNMPTSLVKCIKYPFVKCIKYPFVKCIALINRNAYVEVALTGCNFISGGQRSMKLIDKIASDVADINSAADFMLFTAKIAVTLSAMLMALTIFQDKEGVQQIMVLVALAAIFGYAVAHIFITVYEMAIDTIFICICEDHENNDGVERPYFMSKELLA